MSRPRARPVLLSAVLSALLGPSCSQAPSNTAALAAPKCEATFDADWNQAVGDYTKRMIEPTVPLDDLVQRFTALKECKPTLPGPWRYLADLAEKQHRFPDCAAFANRALDLNSKSRNAAVLISVRDRCTAAASTARH